MSTTLNIQSVELVEDLDASNEARLTMSDGTEIFLNIRQAKPGRGPMLSISTGLGHTVADLDLRTFHRESQ